MQGDGELPDGLDRPGRRGARRGWRSRRARRSATPRTRCSSPCARGARESMPGMLDTVLNLGLNDAVVEGLAREDRERALRVGLLPALRADVRQRRHGHRGRALRGRDQAGQGRPRRQARHRARRRRAAELTERVQGLLRLPRGPAGAARGGDPRGVRLVAGRARGRVPAHQPHPRRLGHRGQRPADGVRQQGRHERARASRSAATRSPARPSRPATSCSTPRARTSSPACATRATSPSCASGCPRRTPSSWRSCARSSSTTATCRTPSSPSRRGGSTCCRRATPSARRRPRCASRATRSTRGCSTKGEALATIDAEKLDALLHPTFDPEAEYDVLAKGVAASPGRGEGRDRLHRRRRGAGRGRRARRHPRAAVHRGRRRRGLPRREGDPHQRGRQGLARGARRARHGRARR